MERYQQERVMDPSTRQQANSELGIQEANPAIHSAWPASSGRSGIKAAEQPRQHTSTAHDRARANSSSSSQSSIDMSPQNEDAIKPDVPHEWGSTQNMVPAGPFLQYLGQNNGLWLGSALLILPPANQNDEMAPVLSLSTGGPSVRIHGRRLDEQDGWTFWRFDLKVQMISEQQAAEYSVQFGSSASPKRLYKFFVPAIQQPVHWGFHSCNGLSAGSDLDMWGEPLLWKDVLKRHQENPIHVMVGGGDQIYNDGFWTAKPFVDWLDIPSDKERFEHAFTMEMEETLNSWVLNHYRQHYTHNLLRDVFATIPQVGQKDDHDVFDGWGSYPKELQLCPVFQGIFRILDRFFLLFQQHTTAQTAYADNDLFGPTQCYSFLRMMGPNQAMLVPDTRGERTRFMVMSKGHYDEIFSRCESLPASVKHLVIVLTVPIIFPKLPLSQEILTKIENVKALKSMMTKTGIGKGILDKFQTVSLLDDIEDHWDSNTHLKERKEFLLRLQQHTKLTRQRISFISGDVHAAQVGRTYTFPKMRHLRHDFRFMPQITSSAIWNKPPPDLLVNLLHKFDKASKLDKNTREKTVKIFKDLHPKNAKVLPRRNWCEVEELATVSAAPGTAPASGWANSLQNTNRSSGMLKLSLRVEDPENKTAVPQVFVTPVPPYVPPKTYEEKRISYRSKQWLTCFAAPEHKSYEDEF